jgi:hypothetical protein
MIYYLTNINKIKEVIKRKGNLSAPGLDKLTYPILKYIPDESAQLISKVMSMMISTQHCPDIWKTGKVVMLPKPVGSKEEKLLRQNWRPIRLIGQYTEFFLG